MRLPGFLCVAGTEAINEVRTHAYFWAEDFAGWHGSQCPCPALDDGFAGVVADPAPWYDSDHPESADFAGVLANFIDLSTVTSRAPSPRADEGSVLGPEVRGGRIIEVTGWMFARSQGGMWWGQNWLKRVLRGSRCANGCTGDEVSILPFCRDTGGPQSDYDGDFRTLLGCGLVAEPTFQPISDDVRSYEGQEVHFQLQSSHPYVFGQPVTAVAVATVGSGAESSHLVTADTWGEGEALTIMVGAGADPVTDVTVELTFSLDGTCPEDRVAVSASYRIPALAAYSAVVIDAPRRQVRYSNPTAHRDESGFGSLRWDGAFCWPVVPACSSMCVRIRNDGASAVAWSLEHRKRELP